MKLNSFRIINLIGFILAVVLLIASYYFEYVEGLQPCLLCLLQRWAMGLVAIVLLIATVHNPRQVGIHIYAAITFVVAIVGIVASARQVWLQHLPSRSTEVCVPGLNFLLQTRPLPEVIKIMFRGSRECAEATWSFLGLTMAQWALIFFVIFALLGLFQLFRKYSTK
jgi:disulfide bond formation protein DsbB